MYVTSGVNVDLMLTLLLFFTLVMLLIGPLVNHLSMLLPEFIVRTFRYGKCNETSGSAGLVSSHPFLSKLLQSVQVDKSYFSHFYIFAVIYTTLYWSVVVSVYTGLWTSPPSLFVAYNNWLSSPSRPIVSTAESSILALSLLLIQVMRRLYECLWINVKSKAKMNIVHYIVGYVHYVCAAPAMVLGSPGLAAAGSRFHVNSHRLLLHSVTVDPRLLFFSPTHIIVVVISGLAFFFQYKSHVSFAELKLKSATSTSVGYGIPRGHLFEYVSCPHYLCEVVIYACLLTLLGLANIHAVALFVWVSANQIVAAIMSHMWYKTTFSDYPKQRRAILPYIL